MSAAAFLRRLCAWIRRSQTRLADQAGIAQAKWLATDVNEYRENCTEFIKKAEATLGYPIFVKPANAGSSVGITKAHDESELREALEKAFSCDRKAVLEEFVDGFEVECAVIGNYKPMASCIGQIISCNEFYDYTAKYVSDSRLLIPAELPEDKQNEVRKEAVRAFKTLGCTGLSRVDFFVRKSDGRVMFNEINTIPGFTSISMYPKLMEQSGVPYPKLLDKLFKLAAEIKEDK